jgi:hypothetical protein
MHNDGHGAWGIEPRELIADSSQLKGKAYLQFWISDWGFRIKNSPILIMF